jgi:tRNA A-37 threonylcarbamoyl transferase component Bud32
MAEYKIGPQIYDAWYQDELKSKYCIKMEYVPGLTMLSCIRSIKSHNYDIRKRILLEYIQKAAKSIDKMHSIDIIHNDLHAGNIIFKPSGKIILIDFETSIIEPSTHQGEVCRKMDIEKFKRNIMCHCVK